MPGVLGKDDGLKRKRKEPKEEVKKRPRTDDTSSSSGDEEETQSKILLLEAAILESKKNYNNIVELIGIARDVENEGESAVLAAVALCRVFIRLLAAGNLTSRRGLSEKEAVVVQWLKDRLSEYKKILVSLLSTEELAPTALTLSMKILKAEGEKLNSNKEFYVFPKDFLAEIVQALFQSRSQAAIKEFTEKYVDEYDDVRFFTHQAIRNLITSHPEAFADPEDFNLVFDLLVAVDGVPDSSDELEDFYMPAPKKKDHNLYSLAQHKKQAQEAWLALMALNLSRDQQKKILGSLVSAIAPWFTKPELLSDFLTDCYNSGSSIALPALSGVFYLINNRNLDYPSFYPKLYSLLDQDILHSKNRTKFFRLLDTFLASSHLPAALVASFIKRLSRLALNAPPSAVVFVVPWIYNLFQRHPLCTFMMHREIRDEGLKASIESEGMKDPFLPDETDPMETQAIDSCVWELVQLQSHYHPNVATIAKIISEQFTKQSYNMEDFLDHSYASLMESEMSKEVKKAPVVEFQIPKRIFLPQEEGSEVTDSLLVKLWDFA
ncbi:probable NOC4 nucleolar protein, forms a complex with Nop14p that mediates maturation and nuclear export of 40S ribosomal subunits [Cephalotrichum gorgonifer]|uniref:Probable NOC4 nucleolar protein, forms a complex with Nop14p that mediates maturation and nuclear export of 40S ribosomal subunits n=1 Tax=Cephalotrichum gorgonifer TaxID=2041049 RepID=A0AAE8MNQ1_9PEZI|nr:probable NOC4 nucleolar protein, forms a complex with Nop14p that mediates maturation and nuclear export of 40S ribosomal subunits [Cephalotrichum gorgonifer]